MYEMYIEEGERRWKGRVKENRHRDGGGGERGGEENVNRWRKMRGRRKG